MNSPGRFAKIFTPLAAVLFCALYLPPIAVFTRLNLAWHDSLFTRDEKSLRPGDPRLILIAVDDESGKKFGFPLPRRVYARALDSLKRAGVRTVAFDIMFFEPSTTGDAELAAATKRFGTVVHLYVPTDTANGRGVSLPIPLLRTATKYFGYPNTTRVIDSDGVIRAYLLGAEDFHDPFGPGAAASLEIAALAADSGRRGVDVLKERGSEEKVINFRRLQDWPQHQGRAGSTPAPGTTPVLSHRVISILDVVDGTLSAEERAALKGSIVIIGSTALGYYDHFPSPLSPDTPGAEFHLTILDNELHGDFLAYGRVRAVLLCILGGAGLAFAAQFIPPLAGAGAAAGTFALWWLYCLRMFHGGFVIDFVPPAVAFAVTYLVLTIRRVVTQDAEKKRIQEMFSHFVAPEVVAELVLDPAKLKLGGDKRELTIFFLDIAHFTNMSERMSPEDLLRFLNRYLTALGGPILRSRGTIDKYIGDCIMAFWNAPAPHADHRAAALLSALECQRIIGELNQTLDPTIPEVPAVRIGVNTGFATVGMTGSQDKLQYTAIGDEVNLASRLEGANKFFGSHIIASEASYQSVRDRIAARTLGRVRVIGKQTPIKIFEPLAETGKLSPDWNTALPIYEKGISAFDERRYAEALALFEKFAVIFPKDGPGQLYLSRCREFAAIPPDAAWTGVFNLTAK